MWWSSVFTSLLIPRSFLPLRHCPSPCSPSSSSLFFLLTPFSSRPPLGLRPLILDCGGLTGAPGGAGWGPRGPAGPVSRGGRWADVGVWWVDVGVKDGSRPHGETNPLSRLVLQSP
ncbi:unnamed protein product [Pleuronectes platessa]|uniref:Secreted protein n=1 Tax=Pleuronectes platessa TaxID=8262 RepID=A0A9N7UU27_PLEPL|nr:unnamed protein product [Pleuronectes platessa]